jgi:hypothetical protein
MFFSSFADWLTYDLCNAESRVDETADLQKHCIEVLAPGYQTFIARRSAESGQK